MPGTPSPRRRHRAGAGSRVARAAALLAVAAVAVSAPRAAPAFCGFYVAGSDARLLNRATMVVLLRDGTRTVLSMQNHYEGPLEDFAMVVPVPVVLTQESVKTLRDEVFERLDRLAAPRLVEYWEQDPCATGQGEGTIGLGSIGTMGSGQGYGAGAGGGLGVTVEARFDVGEYQVVILSATDSSGLETWLRRERYHIPAGASGVLEPYVRAGSRFFVARVNVARVQFANGRARLSPLRFHYDSPDFGLPIRLGLLNSPGTQDLVVHVLARNQRYDVANRPNVTIPTNLDVTDAVRADFGAFYAALFDQTLARNPGAVVTEYAWPSASCDPCPGPALDPSDVYTLGGDVAPSVTGQGDASAGVPQWIQVRLAPPTVVGNLAPEVVRRVVLRNINQVRFCAETGTASAGRRIEGRSTVRIVIGPAGQVMLSEAVAPGVGDAGIDRCIASATRRWTFPTPAGGRPATVTLPFVLQPGGPMVGGRGRFGALNDWVVTRLHMRYGADGVGDDLVFRQASPIVGGRERVRDGDALEQGAQPDVANNFQARYAIRHRWTGPIACASPRRGIWGPPPAGTTPAAPRAATDTAFASRGAVQLASALARPLPELGITAVREPSAVASVDAAVMAHDAGARVTRDAGARATSARGCAARCAAAPAGGRAADPRRSLLAAAAMASLLLARRRRR